MQKLLLLFIPLLFFFSCETEEENVNNCLLYGNWNLDYTETAESVSCLCGYVESSCTETMDYCMTFNIFENGEFISQSSEFDSGEVLGTWSGGCSPKDTVILTPNDNTLDILTLVIQTISNNQLVCSASDEEGGATLFMTK